MDMILRFIIGLLIGGLIGGLFCVVGYLLVCFVQLSFVPINWLYIRGIVGLVAISGIYFCFETSWVER